MLPCEVAYSAHTPTKVPPGNFKNLTFWKKYGKLLGTGIASLIYVLTPEVVIIGGGVCASAQYFLPALEEEIKQRVMPTSRIGLKIIVAQLGNQAGIVGAAKLAWEMWEKQ